AGRADLVNVACPADGRADVAGGRATAVIAAATGRLGAEPAGMVRAPGRGPARRAPGTRPVEPGAVAPGGTARLITARVITARARAGRTRPTARRPPARRPGVARHQRAHQRLLHLSLVGRPGVAVDPVLGPADAVRRADRPVAGAHRRRRVRDRDDPHGHGAV